jgi:hypothetical protein
MAKTLQADRTVQVHVEAKAKANPNRTAKTPVPFDDTDGILSLVTSAISQLPTPNPSR